ncbi:MAG: sensor histidine kinase [Ferruginibacter sp.]|nr:sensor histidine kinase [Ferruginibacter sp.]
MKLLTKLTLFITLSKLLIVVLFVMLLPLLVNRASFQYTNYYLGQQRKKVLAVIQKNGIEYYLQGDTSYGSYTMLKEEYISLSPSSTVALRDTIESSQRIIEADTLNYRVLTHHLTANNKRYQLEIGKTISTIGQYNSLLQRFTLYILIGLIVISILVDLIYTHVLLRPLAKIISSKLVHRKFPFKEALFPVRTSTSDFKLLDRSLMSLMEKIQEAFDKEREFTSNASHELMTPISILKTNIENLLEDESLAEEHQEKILAMMKTLNRLKKIVHSLLYISRIENNQFAMNDTVEVFSLVEEVKDELSHRMEIQDISFINAISPKLIMSQVNHDLLFQLLYNLINNAIRYNKAKGTIHITDRYTQGKPYILQVADTGIGIRPDELGSIFNRFKKSAHSGSEGYGLGLSIVKTIASFQGFDINVTSEFGKCTTFSITVPAGMVLAR